MTDTVLKFAFDVDGLILEMPELFSAVTKALRAAGHRLYIVTDFDESYRAFREAELAKHGIVYDELIITHAKDRVFRDKGIDYAFDDDADYYSSLPRLTFFAASKPKSDS